MPKFDYQKYFKSIKRDMKPVVVPIGAGAPANSLREQVRRIMKEEDNGPLEETIEEALDFYMPEVEDQFPGISKFEITGNPEETLRSAAKARNDRVQREAAAKARKGLSSNPSSADKASPPPEGKKEAKSA